MEYPRHTEPDTVFTQDTLDKLTTGIQSWQQGPGQFGGLHLHDDNFDTSDRRRARMSWAYWRARLSW